MNLPNQNQATQTVPEEVKQDQVDPIKTEGVIGQATKTNPEVVSKQETSKTEKEISDNKKNTDQV